MLYSIDKKGSVDLGRHNFVASGGEGHVYVHGGMAYKVYDDPGNMIPVGKISELSKISNAAVIKPEKVLYQNSNPVGYGMRHVPDSLAICKLFTRAFKDRNGLGPDKIFKLIQTMQNGVNDVHDAGVLIVDVNEMNFLTDSSFSDVFFIDVDSYQTKSYPATALMESVKDWHANGKWTKESDWFSWGVVSFQLFTGIHPFRGKHSSVKGFIDRMKGNISVFNGDVRVPKSVSSFDIIPQAYRDWYKAVFEEGKRVAPPFGPCVVISVVPLRKISSSAGIEVTSIAKAENEVIKYLNLDGNEIVVTRDEASCGKHALRFPCGTDMSALSFSLFENEVVCGYEDYGIARFKFLDGTLVPSNLYCERMFDYNGRAYIKNGTGIFEIKFLRMGKVAKAFGSLVANVMQSATTICDGVIVQDMLGSWYVSIFPEEKTSRTIKLDDLDGHRVIDAKYEFGVLMIVSILGGAYTKFVYRFNGGSLSFDLFWKDEGIVYSGINFVVLDRGVCAHIDEKEELVLFSNRPVSQDVKRVRDAAVSNDMRLCKRSDEVLFVRGKEVFKISMRK